MAKKKRRYKAKDSHNTKNEYFAKGSFREMRQNSKSVNKPRRNTAMDTFANMISMLGEGMPNVMNGTEYPITRLTQDYNLINSLYRNHWIVRKIIDTIPEDMMKNWIDIQADFTPDQMKELDTVIRTTKVKEKIKEGLKLGRLYGGACAVMIIQGHENILDEPLNYDEIMPGSFKGLMVCDRWMGIFPSAEIIEDINNPEFGMPKYYEWTIEGSETVKVHHSRVLQFRGRDLPYIEEQIEMHWGESEVEVIFEELKKRDNTSYNIANLIFMANLRVMGIEGLGQNIVMGDQEALAEVYKVAQIQNRLMNNSGMMLMDKDDTFATHQYTFSGINDIYESFMCDISGAAEIPVTKLFGRAPAGLNATGDGDLQNYYDTVSQKQVSQLQPQLDKLNPVLFMSTFGYIPNNYDYTFNPIASQSESELADIVDRKVNAINTVFGSGIISQKIATKELKELSDTTGMFTNITDEDIEKASDDVETGEFGGLGEYEDMEETPGKEILQNNSKTYEKASDQDKWTQKFIRYIRGDS